jgi:hypothetical protein
VWGSESTRQPAGHAGSGLSGRRPRGAWNSTSLRGVWAAACRVVEVEAGTASALHQAVRAPRERGAGRGDSAPMWIQCGSNVDPMWIQ